MGNYLSNDFYIYGRKKDTDKYDLLCELKEGTPMSRFKHEVYAYALKKRYKDMKSLYLYCGYSRVAKAIMSRENEILYLHIVFSGDEIAKEFEQCQEQIQNVYIDISWLEKTFLDSWCPMDSPNILEHKYENYKMNIE
tara:strand:- start:36 stop:449 length:414 start_codon:yes stop_codon:yes gene_type:complete